MFAPRPGSAKAGRLEIATAVVRTKSLTLVRCIPTLLLLHVHSIVLCGSSAVARCAARCRGSRWPVCQRNCRAKANQPKPLMILFRAPVHCELLLAWRKLFAARIDP